MALRRLQAMALGALLAGCAASPGPDGEGPDLRGGERRLQSIGDGQRHASAHLRYHPPAAVQRAQSWYMSVKPKHSSEDTFFSVLGNNMGYAGLQQVEAHGLWFQGKAIFSIWDQGCNHLMDPGACPQEQRAEIIECGSRAICTTFGNEGTGLKSYINFHEWSVEQEYSFVIQVFLEGNNKARQDCYFYAPELGGWVLLAKLRVGISHEWQLQSTYSFVEQWSTRAGEDIRFARFGDNFMEQTNAAPSEWRWVQVTQATWSHTDGPNEVATNVDGNVTSGGTKWGLGIGGSLQRTIRDGDPLTLTQPRTADWPAPLQSWNQMRQGGALPGGCLGKTCMDTAIVQWFCSALTLEYIPITCIVLLLVAICLCTGAYQCVGARLGLTGQAAKTAPGPSQAQLMQPPASRARSGGYGYEQPQYGYQRAPFQGR